MKGSASDTAAPTAVVADAAPGGLPTRVRLEVVEGPDDGRSLLLQRGSYVVGKSTGCDLVLSDPTISRRHLELVFGNGRLLCRDLGSTNGSWAGGNRFQELELGMGGIVRIGGTSLKVTTPDPVVAGPPAPEREADFAGLSGRSARMREVYALCERAAASDAPVLIRGETGTGKAVCAAAIHAKGPRARRPFVVCDLAAASRTLIESELFGHVRGAFTGATTEHPGAFRQADGGAIFIDEIGELEAELQPRLLRALDRRQVKPLGGTAFRTVDVRIIAATNRDLQEEVRRGRFRSDLYYRLNVLRIELPPLRDRKEDIPLLVERFVAEFRHGRRVELPPETLALLAAYDWPGNVRELRNTVERALAMAPDALRLEPQLLALDLPGAADLPTMQENLPFHEAKDRLVGAWEREYLAGLVRRTAGNLSEAARRAGIDRPYLYRLLRKHGLEREEGNGAPDR
jgi:DNA-binding NtrC family response regulator